MRVIDIQDQNPKVKRLGNLAGDMLEAEARTLNNNCESCKDFTQNVIAET